MSLDIHLKYNLYDKVFIKKLKINGIVLSIWISNKCIKYKVRYFNDGNAREVYFLEQELEVENKNPIIGFNL